VARLERLWTRIPQSRRQELIGYLTRILTQRLTASASKEVADE
jgi:hypothetical protein